MEWEHQIEKKANKKYKTLAKIEVKLPQLNKKSQSIRRTFVQTPFSHSNLKLQSKSFTAVNNWLFRSASCRGVKISWKNKTAPQCNSNFLNCINNVVLANLKFNAQLSLSEREIWENLFEQHNYSVCFKTRYFTFLTFFSVLHLNFQKLFKIETLN